MLPLARILVAVDLGPTSTTILSHANDLARLAGATLWVLHVYASDDPEGATPPEPDPRREAASTALRALLADLPGAEVVLVPRTHAEATVVLEVAERSACDLIVIGTHGRSGLTRVLLGSVAEQVLRGAARPVLVVPTRG